MGVFPKKGEVKLFPSMDGPVSEKDVAKLWGDLIRNPAVHWPETPLRPALEILSDATKAFSANANLGTAILCRAAIDGAFLIYLTYSETDRTTNEWRIDFPVGLDGKMRDISWSELKGGIAKAGVFAAPDLEAIESVRNHGNLAAHLMERQLRFLHSRVNNETMGDEQSVMPWIVPGDTWQHLRKTAEVLERLCVALYERTCDQGPASEDSESFFV